MRYISSLVLVFLVAAHISHAQPELLFMKAYGGSREDVSFKVVPAWDGGYIAAGYAKSIDGDVTHPTGESIFKYSAWVVKYDVYGNVTWDTCYGDYGSEKEEGFYDIARTSEGGYIMCGFTGASDFDSDYWVVKTDADGNILWRKKFGGSEDDDAMSVIESSDGNYVVTGVSSSNDGDVTGHHTGVAVADDIWVIKLNTDGNLVWQKSLGGTNTEYVHPASSIVETPDGGYITGCRTYSNNTGDITGSFGAEDGWIVKLDTDGNILWQKCLGTIVNDAVYGIAMKDEHILVAGARTSACCSPAFDAWFAELDAVGNILQEEIYGGTETEQFLDVEVLDDGYILFGYAESSDGDPGMNYGEEDVWVIQTDFAGSIIWSKVLGGSEIDIPGSITRVGDGDYVFAGFSRSDDHMVTGSEITGAEYPDFTNEQFLVGRISDDYFITLDPVAGQDICEGDEIVVPYSSSDGFVTGNIFTAELSAPDGSFGLPVVIGILPSESPEGTIICTLPEEMETSVSYKVRVIASDPAEIAQENITQLEYECDYPVILDNVLTPGTLEIFWNAVPCAHHYDVKYKLAGGGWTTVSTGGTSMLLTGLTPGATYKVRLTTVCGGGLGKSLQSPAYTYLIPMRAGDTVEDIVLFPNPAHALLYISGIAFDEITAVEVWTLTGQQIPVQMRAGNPGVIELPALDTQYLLVQISTQSAIFRKILLVE